MTSGDGTGVHPVPPGASCGLSQAAAAPEANVLAAPLEDADPLAAPVANVLPAPKTQTPDTKSPKACPKTTCS